MPCLRHTSAVFAPASCSCRIAMICSSLNRLRFIVRPPSGGRTLLKSGGASGAQVTYNVKKLSESGYLVYERSAHDRRSIRVRLTSKGRTLRDRLSSMLARHIEMLGQTQISDTDLQRTAASLQQLERFWMRPDISR